MKHTLLAALATTALTALPAFAVEKAEVLDTYADIAAAKYADSLDTAQVLQTAVEALLAEPSAEALEVARAAWRACPTCKPKFTGSATRSSTIGKAA